MLMEWNSVLDTKKNRFVAKPPLQILSTQHSWIVYCYIRTIKVAGNNQEQCQNVVYKIEKSEALQIDGKTLNIQTKQLNAKMDLMIPLYQNQYVNSYILDWTKFRKANKEIRSLLERKPIIMDVFRKTRTQFTVTVVILILTLIILLELAGVFIQYRYKVKQRNTRLHLAVEKVEKNDDGRNPL